MDETGDIATWVGPWVEDPDVVLPRGRHEFVVGDVHGCAAQFAAVLGLVADMGRAARDPRLVLLGDLVDRGPDSLGCLRLAGAAEVTAGMPRVLLTGNHEAMMLAALGVPPGRLRFSDWRDAWGAWLGNGGGKVLEEMEAVLGGEIPRDLRGEELLDRTAGPEAREMLAAARTHVRTGSLLLCHAGIPHEVEVEEWFSTPSWPVHREDRSWAWVRGPFLLVCDIPFEDKGEPMLVVHGHTVESLARRQWRGQGHISRFSQLHARDGWRIGLDGGSYASSVVAGAEFADGAWRLFGAGVPERAAAVGLEFPPSPAH